MTKNYLSTTAMIDYILTSYYNITLCQLLVGKEVISKLESGEYTSEEIEMIYTDFTKKYDETLIQYQYIESINVRIGSLNFIINKINDVITNKYRQKKGIKEIDKISFEDIYKDNCGNNGVIDDKLFIISHVVDELESSVSKINKIFP